MDSYGSTYSTPGWQRAQQRTQNAGSARQTFAQPASRRGPLQIEGELVAKSSASSAFAKGTRVFHLKFGNGTVAAADGNKLTVDFDKAGRKMVLDSFLKAS
jgi:DNA helicase-2/ATP-dependent DNA helicase PcrA